MSSTIEDKVKKLREERIAREQARIQKLRDLNMKKYPKSETTHQPEKKSSSTSQIKVATNTRNIQETGNIKLKTNQMNTTNKRPVTVPVPKKPDYSNVKSKVVTKFGTKSDINGTKSDTNATKTEISGTKVQAKSQNELAKNKNITNIPRSAKKPKKMDKPSTSNLTLIAKPDIIITEPSDNESQNSDTKINLEKSVDNKNSSNNDVPSKPDIVITTQSNLTKHVNDKKVLTEITKKVTCNTKLFLKNDVKSRKSYAPTSTMQGLEKPKNNSRKSMLPRLAEGTKSESVFDRLYKPKITKKPEPITEAEKLRTNPNYMKKVIKNADLVYNMQKKPDNKFHQRRSISAVHFKRISKSEMGNCIHKWGSISDNLHKIISAEDIVNKDVKVTSAVKSERKRVQFYTPGLNSFNTPRPDELQARLKSWLQRRGKSLSSYQHLHCFGLHHLKNVPDTPRSVISMRYEDTVQSPAFDEENKENIALESDSDDGSYNELMNEPKVFTPRCHIDVTNWRNASMTSESVFNESGESHQLNDVTLTPANSMAIVEDLLHGALNDLSLLLREGFDWQQAARWLRSIKSRFPEAPRTAAYWECRAALEDARGNLNASLDCWKEAIAKGTEESVADSNLDQLLTKFMKLELSPGGGAAPPDPKLLDVKNVFKTTLIKFAVQEARLNKPSTPPLFTVTPVRRSARLSRRVSRTPLRLCDTVRQAATLAPDHVFTPNKNLVPTP